MNTEMNIRAGLRAMSGHTPSPAVDIEHLETQIQRRQKRVNFTRAVSAVAAAAVIITGTVLAISAVMNNATAATLTLDSSASIVISLNSRDEVVSVTAADQRGERALSGYALTSADPGDTVRGLVTHLIDNDTLSIYDNTVLLTADGTDDEARALSTAECVSTAYRDSGFDGAVLSQSADDSSDAAHLSARYHISQGKARLIRELIDADSTMSAAELSRMSVNDLNLIAGSIHLQYKNISAFGASSALGYLKIKDAERIVTEDLDAAGRQIALSARLDAKNGELLYRLTARDGDTTYAYSLVAKSGEIITVIRYDISGAEVLINRRSSTAQPDGDTYSGNIIAPVTPSAEPAPTAAPQDNLTTAPTAPPVSPTRPEQPDSGTAPSAPSATETPATPDGVSLTSDSYYSVDADLMSAGYVLMTPPAGSRKLDLSHRFTGQHLVSYSGEQQFLSGTVAVICNTRQLNQFFREYNYPYTYLSDDGEVALDASGYTDSFFADKALLIAEYDLHNMPYDFHIDNVYADGDNLYVDTAMTMPENVRAWYMTYHNICIYAIDRAELKADMQLVLY